MAELKSELIEDHVARALTEDIGSGDVTTLALVPKEHQITARIVARESLVLSGVALAKAAFSQLSPEIRIIREAVDGEELVEGDEILEFTGPGRALLTAERTALNYLQRLSGIATQASKYVQAVQGTGVLILDTRKTTPGWRALEKYAIQCGGARNHRRGLDDMILIKDNHLAALPNGPSIAAAIARAREASPELKIEVEADTLAQAVEAAESGADIVMLDNMSPADLKEAVEKIGGISQTEASGGISLDTIRTVAETGVDYISVGALTHSAQAVDIAMDMDS